MPKSWVAVILFACGVVALAQQLGQKMTNQDVIDMVSMGLSDELIIDKIRASDTPAFDTSVPALRVLKAAKVSDSLIRAMVNPHPAATVGTAPANPMETVESLESRLAQTPECANATDSIKCRDKVASLLQGNVKNYPSMRITAVDHVLLYTDPLALSKREARDSLHNFAQNAGQSFLCKYKFTTIRVEADRVTGEEYDLGCPKAPVSAPIPNDPGTSTAPEVAVPKAQEPATTSAQSQDFFVSYSTTLSTLHPGTCIGKYCTYDYNTYECQMRLYTSNRIYVVSGATKYCSSVGITFTGSLGGGALTVQYQDKKGKTSTYKWRIQEIADR